jgi:Spx/MgsR family transcriptional regulator
VSTPAVVLYGIPNCDTVKRARAWLADRGVAVRFHDFKREGVPAQRLEVWLDVAGWERLLNRKGTAWRALDESMRNGVSDRPSAQAVMLAHASTIKRPVVEWGKDAVTIGFDADDWTQRLR